jgi:hypothetical protein
MADAELALLASLLTDPSRTAELAGLSGSAIRDLVAVARQHGVEAWLAEYAPRTAQWRDLTEQRPRFVAAALRNIETLRQFGAIADSVGCSWVAVKGQAVAEDLYPAKQLRHGVDVDVLVSPGRFAKLLAELSISGWTLLDRNWPLLVASMPGQLRLTSPTGELLDLHWHLMNNPQLRRDFVLPTDELLRRARRLPSGLPVLDAADQLVHLGIHGAQSGGNRLTWLADVGFAARRTTDWSLLSERAAAAGAGPALGLMLLRAHRWLETPAPQPALAGMRAGAGWRWWCRAIDRRYPIEPDPNRAALSRAVARSARATAFASGVEFAGHAVGWLRGGAKRDRAASALSDPEDVRSPLHDVEDAGARERYLAAVSAFD